MNGFLGNLRYKFSSWMQGRYGMDELFIALWVVGLVLTFIDVFVNTMIISLLGLLVLLYALFRFCSKNAAARRKELTTYQRLMAKPKKWWKHLNIRYINRKTTKYFKCKGCGTMLSVPRGKGTLKVRCPKCEATSTIKS